MSEFHSALAAYKTSATKRRWLFVPYDQLTSAIGPLAREPAKELGIVVVECPDKAARRPYHKQKLALLLTNLRHFAIEQAARGVAVQHVVAPSYRAAIAGVAPKLGALRVMRPAERELRAELAPLFESGELEEVPHEGWLTTPEDFAAAGAKPPWRMDAFYRQVRRRLDILMVKGKPMGGRFSFDAENREAWTGTPKAPALPRYQVDAITAEVCDLVATRMARHPGVLDPGGIPATRADAERTWAWAKTQCLAHFGPFEDAMSTDSRTLFHTRISPLLNLQRLSARTIVDDTVALDIPFASKEGFVRQILGWREYVRHVHEATDGFRVIGGVAQPVAKSPGDGGYGQWAGSAWAPAASGGDGGSQTSILGAARPVPPAYWGKRSGLRCLDEVVASVWDEGYSHHITRLMVLANIAMLLDVSPRDLTDWFWVAYIDAYDWVVEPNVHGMGTFGVGDVLTTKPYVAGSAYIHKMSNFCKGCRFKPKKTCPLTSLYWAYLGRHREALARVDRMTLSVRSEARRTPAQRASDADVFARVTSTLARGDELPEDIASASLGEGR